MAKPSQYLTLFMVVAVGAYLYIYFYSNRYYMREVETCTTECDGKPTPPQEKNDFLEEFEQKVQSASQFQGRMLEMYSGGPEKKEVMPRKELNSSVPPPNRFILEQGQLGAHYEQEVKSAQEAVTNTQNGLSSLQGIQWKEKPIREQELRIFPVTGTKKRVYEGRPQPGLATLGAEQVVRKLPQLTRSTDKYVQMDWKGGAKASWQPADTRQTAGELNRKAKDKLPNLDMSTGSSFSTKSSVQGQVMQPLVPLEVQKDRTYAGYTGPGKVAGPKSQPIPGQIMPVLQQNKDYSLPLLGGAATVRSAFPMRSDADPYHGNELQSSRINIAGQMQTPGGGEHYGGEYFVTGSQMQGLAARAEHGQLQQQQAQQRASQYVRGRMLPAMTSREEHGTLVAQQGTAKRQGDTTFLKGRYLQGAAYQQQHGKQMPDESKRIDQSNKYVVKGRVEPNLGPRGGQAHGTDAHAAFAGYKLRPERQAMEMSGLAAVATGGKRLDDGGLGKVIIRGRL